MKVSGRDLDVIKESTLVEQDHTYIMVCHVEAIRQEHVLEVLFNCFLQGDDATSPHYVFRLLFFHVEALTSNF